MRPAFLQVSRPGTIWLALACLPIALPLAFVAVIGALAGELLARLGKFVFHLEPPLDRAPGDADGQ